MLPVGGAHGSYTRVSPAFLAAFISGAETDRWRPFRQLVLHLSPIVLQDEAAIAMFLFYYVTL